MQPDRLGDVDLDLFAGGAGTDAPGQVGHVGGEVPVSLFDHDCERLIGASLSPARRRIDRWRTGSVSGRATGLAVQDAHPPGRRRGAWSRYQPSHFLLTHPGLRVPGT